MTNYLTGYRVLVNVGKKVCVYNAGLKDDTAQEILTVIMKSNDENVD